ncbi:MAG: N-acetyltransferase [Rhodobacteraceae bacterium]|nr:N-acetyltransferase [Paracoccaceae bacterium]
MAQLVAEIRREDGPTKGRYVYHPDPAHPPALMTFSKAGTQQIIIDHTEVPDAYRGQGIGLALVTRAVEDARRDGIRITPLCPYAASQFRRHPDWSDVLA